MSISCGVVVDKGSNLSLVDSSSIVEVISDAGGVTVVLVLAIDVLIMLVALGVVAEIVLSTLETKVESEKLLTFNAIYLFHSLLNDNRVCPIFCYDILDID